MQDKKNIIFFARVQFAHFYTQLISNQYNSFYVCLNKQEKQIIESYGKEVEACFEEEYDFLEISDIPNDFLQSSYYSDRFLGWLTIDDRIEILGKEITFWRKIFNKRKYNYCVHETITLEIEEVMSLIAEENQCRDMTAIFSFLDGYFYWKPSPYNSSFSKKMIEDATPTEKHIEVIIDYVKKVKMTGHRPYYSKVKYCSISAFYLFLKNYIKILINKFVTYGIIKKDILFFYNSKYNIFKYRHYIFDCALIRRFHKNYYNKLENYNHYKKILFPMHLEPEATLLYFSPKFSNQVSLIQDIAKQLPKDYILAVKEHPAQYGQLRQEEFKKLRERNSNIIFLSIDEDSHSLLKNVDAIATITGNVGLEAIINNIPVILFGNVFYDLHDSVHKIEDMGQFRELLLNRSLKVPDDRGTILFLSKLLTFFHNGYPLDIRLHADDDNIKKIVYSIEKEISVE